MAAGRGAVSRTRRLRFERCESRIALSAADGDFSDVTTSVAGDHQILRSDYVVESGGAITISFNAMDFTRWSASSENGVGLRGGAFGNLASLGDVSLSTLWQRAVGAKQDRFEVEWSLGTGATFGGIGAEAARGNDFSMFDDAFGGEYEMPLNASDQTGPSVNSDLSVIPPPMPTPADEPSAGNQHEGGQIALTPFIAPTGLTLSQGYGSSGIARAKTNLEDLSETPDAPSADAARLESLRGRAVVYEVAESGRVTLPDGHDPDEPPSEQDERYVALAMLDELAATGEQRRAAPSIGDDAQPLEPSETAATVADVVTGADFEISGFLSAVSLSMNGEPIEGLGSLSAAAAHLDEALAEWSVENGGEDPANLATGDRDRRALGVGVAMALAVVPLRKALHRRPSEIRPTNSPRRRRS
jgi:hypothetical protein